MRLPARWSSGGAISTGTRRLAFEEHRTSSVVRAFLEATGIEVRACGGTGLRGVLQGRAPGPDGRAARRHGRAAGGRDRRPRLPVAEPGRHARLRPRRPHGHPHGRGPNPRRAARDARGERRLPVPALGGEPSRRRAADDRGGRPGRRRQHLRPPPVAAAADGRRGPARGRHDGAGRTSSRWWSTGAAATRRSRSSRSTRSSSPRTSSSRRRRSSAGSPIRSKPPSCRSRPSTAGGSTTSSPTR